MGLIEAVPNISEGRRTDVIDAIADTLEACVGVTLLDTSSDAAHNRTVFTLLGKPQPIKSALIALFAAAIEQIDLRTHTGEHPRIGAVDVAPLVPLEPREMPNCVALARDLGSVVAETFDLPVYLYENAARTPDRGKLELIRRGGFEGLTQKMLTREWHPDFGPKQPHPSAGASAIGARRILIAFNINLDSEDIDVAIQVARAIRESNGGLQAVKAIGVRTSKSNLVQVSINLVDYQRTPLSRVFKAVEYQAHRLGVTIHNSEIIGLPPSDAISTEDIQSLKLTDFTSDDLLESRISREVSSPVSRDRDHDLL